MDIKLAKKIGSHWSSQKTPDKTRWWHSPTIIKHVNSIVCGKSLDGLSSGLIDSVKNLFGESLPLEKGVSVGCGNGVKEMELVQRGVVKSFDLFELSIERIIKGRTIAEEKGLEGRIKFYEGDAFAMVTEKEVYDLVHWNNSLHHMMDVFHAMNWSKQVLKTEGLFYMDDFVGSNRFQWPDKQLEIASGVRKSLIGTKYLRNPNKKHFFSRSAIPIKIRRPLHLPDPSEAVDSENILPAIKKFFPKAKTTLTGGVIYHLALSNVIYNFDENDPNDVKVLKELLSLEKSCIEQGETHYAVSLSQK